MRVAHSVEAVRVAERALMARVPDGELMQRAAHGVARRAALLLDGVYGSRVVLLVGKGNNGGDALYAGARLAARGARVDALLLGARNDAAVRALLLAGGRAAEAGADRDEALVGAADLVVDGILGIGGSGGLRPDAARLAAFAHASRATVLAVDVPSGVDADTGAVGGEAVTADVTVCPGTLKRGLLVQPGAAHTGTVEVLDIGLGADLGEPDLVALDADDVAALLPTPGLAASKYTRGVLGLVAGSAAYTGAAVLSSGGALRGGAGFVRFASSGRPADAVRAAHPEVVVTTVAEGDAEAVLGVGRVQAWAAGPGLGTGVEAARVVEALLGTDLPLLLDADALTVVAEHREWLRRDAPTLLTPHEGEFARLTGDDAEAVRADRLGAARRAAADLGVTLLLKGSRTLVVEPDGRARVNTTADGRLATAGSGDVLTGVCGSLLAAGLSAFDAASGGAFLHGLAGRLAPEPVAAGDLLASLPAAVRVVRSGA